MMTGGSLVESRQSLRRWWGDLSPRERFMLLGGAAILGTLMLLMVVWWPLLDQQRNLESQREASLEALGMMERQAAEAEQLRRLQTVAATLEEGDSLLSLADRTARLQGLGGVLKRVEPEGPRKVRLWFEEAPFQSLIGFLAVLRGGHGVKAGQVLLERSEREGQVNAQLLLSL